MAKKHSPYAQRVWTRILFLAYVGLMIWLLFLQRVDTGGTIVEQNWNFVPLKTLKLYWKLLSSGNEYYVRQAVINLVGNVVMFIPLGFFLPVVWKPLRKFWLCLLCAFGIVVLVELIQWLTGLGSCDVDDLVLNIPGVIIGYWVYAPILGSRH